MDANESRQRQWRCGTAKYREKMALTHKRMNVYVSKEAVKALQRKAVGSKDRFGVWVGKWIDEQALS